ncbi:MAG TPA: hypothetical protein VHX14_01740 [Thermoanaerobaculia bacterium]|jgi:hypothetical protein|nr:hypothetical protein [Thermoanaerobaculia bacterium]
MNVNQLIIDYIVICDKRGQILDLADFVRLWSVANEIAEERAKGGEFS